MFADERTTDTGTCDDRRRSGAGPLCCCQYVDRNREINHLAACCCNCVDLDLAFDRLICCRRVPGQTSSNMLHTLQDRLRIPWPGGARRVPFTTILPLVLVPGVLVVAACGLIWTCAMLVAVPAFLLYMGRHLGRTEPRTKFFLAWNVWSVLFLWILFESTVPLLEVLPEENFAMILLMTVSVLCFYKVRERAPMNFVTSRNDDPIVANGKPTTSVAIDNACDTTMLQMDDVLGVYDDNEHTDDDADIDADDDDCESAPLSAAAAAAAANPAVCRHCRKYAPPRAHHCFVCRTCVARQDHHNVWLDCCIGQNGYRLYFVGGAFAVMALQLAANLALTSICHPFLVGTVFGVHVFLPDNCADVYDQFDVAMCFVGSLYALAMAFCLFVDWLRQAWQITVGVTWAEQRRGLRENRRNVLHNWKVFLCLMRD